MNFSLTPKTVTHSAKRQIGRDDRGAALAAIRNQVEEQLTTQPIEGDVSRPRLTPAQPVRGRVARRAQWHAPDLARLGLSRAEERVPSGSFRRPHLASWHPPHIVLMASRQKIEGSRRHDGVPVWQPCPVRSSSPKEAPPASPCGARYAPATQKLANVDRRI